MAFEKCMNFAGRDIGEIIHVIKAFKKYFTDFHIAKVKPL